LAGRKNQGCRIRHETQRKLELDSPVANLFGNDPRKQDIDPDRHRLRRQLKSGIAVTRDGEGRNDQRQYGCEATDRETGEKGKRKATYGRKGEDRQGEAIGALEEEDAGEGAGEEEGERSPGDNAQNEGIGRRDLAYRPTLLQDHRVFEFG
jgi:hypothetical protein